MIGWVFAIVGWSLLAFSLAHNITTASALRKGLGDAYKKKIAEWNHQ